MSNDCVTNFWLGQAYCVSLGPLVSSTSTTSTFVNSTFSITSWPNISTPDSTRYPATN